MTPSGSSEITPADKGDSAQPSTPSGEGQGSEQQPKTDAGHSFWNRLAAPFRAVDDPESDVSRREAAAKAKTAADDKPVEGEGTAEKPKEGEQGKDGQPFKVFQTKEELEREVQGEADRREAIRARRAAAQQREQLKQDDPEAAYAIERDEAAKVEIAGSVVDVFDSLILKPVFDQLPDDKRAEVTGSINSVESRQAAVTTALKHIEDAAYERGKTDGEKEGQAKARQNPAFRKEISSEIRQTRGDELELVEAASGGNGHKPDMNNWLAGRAGIARR